MEQQIFLDEDQYLDIQETGTSLVKRAESFIITNDQQNLQATDILNELKKIMKDAKEKRDSIVKPLDAAKKAADKLYKEITEPLEKAERYIKNLMGDYFQKKEAERRRLQAIEDERLKKAQAKYEVKAAKAEEKGVTLPPAPVATIVQAPEKTVKAESGASSTVTMEWTYEILDENKVPEQYKRVHPPLINAAVKSGVRDIPGVRIFQQPKISVRTV